MSSVEPLMNEAILYGDQAVNKNQYLTFILADEEYGVDILQVQEIKGWESVTPIPNAPAHVKGVVNIRGTIVPVIDLRLRFGLEQLEYGPTTVMIVLKVNSGDNNRVMGIVVDAVSDVYDIGSEEVRSAPDFGDDVSVEYLKGLATVNEKMVILLNIDSLLNADEIRFASRNSSPLNSSHTELDIETLERSFKEISPKGELLVNRFYEELFNRYPDVKPLFNSTSMEEQHKKLLAALNLVISNVGNPQALKDTLADLGQRHRGYGVKQEHYAAVKATLLDVMREVAGPSWNDASYKAWNAGLQFVASSMMQMANGG